MCVCVSCRVCSSAMLLEGIPGLHFVTLIPTHFFFICNDALLSHLDFLYRAFLLRLGGRNNNQNRCRRKLFYIDIGLFYCLPTDLVIQPRNQLSVLFLLSLGSSYP